MHNNTIAITVAAVIIIAVVAVDGLLLYWEACC
jgi:hypothetical protein